MRSRNLMMMMMMMMVMVVVVVVVGHFYTLTFLPTVSIS